MQSQGRPCSMEGACMPWVRTHRCTGVNQHLPSSIPVASFGNTERNKNVEGSFRNKFKKKTKQKNKKNGSESESQKKISNTIKRDTQGTSQGKHLRYMISWRRILLPEECSIAGHFLHWRSAFCSTKSQNPCKTLHLLRDHQNIF